MKKWIAGLVITSLIIFIPLLHPEADARKKMQKTSLELQAIQAREFETTRQIAFAAVISVFQDLGYIVESAEIETGFVTAKSPTQKARPALFQSDITHETKVSAFIENLPQHRVRVRLNFVNSKENISQWSGVQRTLDQVVEDPAIYQEAFTKIEEAVFIKASLDQTNENTIKVEVQQPEPFPAGQKDPLPSKSIAEEIEQLHQLKEKGILTEKEFETAKKKLLGFE